jgi:hypothetical protein
LGDETAPATSVTFGAPGDYVLRLTASNAFAQTVSDLPVAVAGPPQIGALTAGNGQFGFQVSGAAGFAHTVQASSNLLTWTSWFTTNPVSMPFTWAGAVSGSVGRQFYRVIIGP